MIWKLFLAFIGLCLAGIAIFLPFLILGILSNIYYNKKYFILTILIQVVYIFLLFPIKMKLFPYYKTLEWLIEIGIFGIIICIFCLLIVFIEKKRNN